MRTLPNSALIRPGRFDRTIAVPLPDIRGRVQILNHHMKGVTTSPGIDLLAHEISRSREIEAC